MSHDVGNNCDCDVDIDHRNNTTSRRLVNVDIAPGLDHVITLMALADSARNRNISGFHLA